MGKVGRPAHHEDRDVMMMCCREIACGLAEMNGTKSFSRARDDAIESATCETDQIVVQTKSLPYHESLSRDSTKLCSEMKV